jgi:hypothetical protein
MTVHLSYISCSIKEGLSVIALADGVLWWGQEAARNIPRIPHIPRGRTPGNGEPGNEGNGGKDIAVNDLVSSNAKRTPSVAAIAR